MKKVFYGIVPLFCMQLSALIIENSTSQVKPASFYSDYLLAEFFIAKNKPEDALSMLETLSKSPVSKTTELFLDNVTVRALYRAERFGDIANRPFKSEGKELSLLFAESYLKSGKEKEAHALLSKMIQENPLCDEAVYLLVALLSQQKKNDEALKVLDTFLKRDNLQSRHAFFFFLQAKMHIEKNDFKNAHRALKKCVELNPLFDKAWLLEAVLYQQENNIDDAIYCFKKCIDLIEDNGVVYKQYLALLFKQERFREAYEELTKRPEDTDEFYCDCALLEFRLEKYEEALRTVEKALSKNKSFTKACLLKAELLVRLKKNKEAVSWVIHWLAQDKNNTIALTALLSLEKQGVPLSVITTILKKLNTPFQSRILMAALADMYLSHASFKEARACYENIVGRVHDAALKSKLYYLISFCHFKEGSMNKVEEPLKQALITGETFPPTYNLLAYYYATTGNNLSYALELINVALKQEENNSDFLDTKGYILVRLGKSKEAATLFHKALVHSPQNKIILEHLSLVQ